MNKKALSTLEYDKIIEMLVSHASSPLGINPLRRPPPLRLHCRDRVQTGADAGRPHPAVSKGKISLEV